MVPTVFIIYVKTACQNNQLEQSPQKCKKELNKVRKINSYQMKRSRWNHRPWQLLNENRVHTPDHEKNRPWQKVRMQEVSLSMIFTNRFNFTGYPITAKKTKLICGFVDKSACTLIDCCINQEKQHNKQTTTLTVVFWILFIVSTLTLTLECGFIFPFPILFL